MRPTLRSLALLALAVACTTAPVDGPPAPSAGVSSSVDAGDAERGLVLHVLSPAAGDRVVDPFPIRYRIVGAASGARLHLHAYVDESGPYELELGGPTGTATFRGTPLTSGRRVLTLELVTRDHERVAPPVVIRDLIIEGDRSAG